MDIVYSPVKTCTYNNDLSKSWFVYFEVTDRDLGITIKKQYRGGVNYFKTVSSRTKRCNELAAFWSRRLKDGWNPFDDDTEESSGMQLSKALDWGLQKCVVATKTRLDYACTVRFTKTAAEKLGLSHAKVAGIQKKHILLLLDEIKKERQWSNHAYNKNSGYLSAIFSQLEKYQIIASNPAAKIDSLPVAESNYYQPFTAAEKKVLRSKLPGIHKNFYNFLMLEYHTGIRPKESLALKISDVYLKNRLIKIVPLLAEENSKTKNIRLVPLNDHIFNILSEHIAGDLPNDYYIFGRPPGERSDASAPAYFSPSRLRIKRDTATKLYKKLVWNGLKIHKHMYALKHTGADDKILAGVSLDALRSMYGHTSKQMTERYVTKLKQLYDAEIKEKSPDF